MAVWQWFWTLVGFIIFIIVLIFLYFYQPFEDLFNLVINGLGFDNTIFWVALIILLWLIFEALLWLFETLQNAGYNYLAWLAVVLAIVILAYVFRLVHAQQFLTLAIAVLIGMLYVFWRARRP